MGGWMDGQIDSQSEGGRGRGRERKGERERLDPISHGDCKNQVITPWPAKSGLAVLKIKCVEPPKGSIFC